MDNTARLVPNHGRAAGSLAVGAQGAFQFVAWLADDFGGDSVVTETEVLAGFLKRRVDAWVLDEYVPRHNSLPPTAVVGSRGTEAAGAQERTFYRGAARIQPPMFRKGVIEVEMFPGKPSWGGWIVLRQIMRRQGRLRGARRSVCGPGWGVG
ncbi:MAG TPA: hypothetical protein VNA25_25660 [Phycisphaerae bacterium]|nr:hypothetical protein [Phycisphaerae bacterium]